LGRAGLGFWRLGGRAEKKKKKPEIVAVGHLH